MCAIKSTLRRQPVVVIKSQCTLESSPAKIQFDLPPYLSGLPAACSGSVIQASLPGDNRALEPPDSIPNSEVKRCIADGSVGFPHVRVGHRQASKKENPEYESAWGFLLPIREIERPIGRVCYSLTFHSSTRCRSIYRYLTPPLMTAFGVSSNSICSMGFPFTATTSPA